MYNFIVVIRSSIVDINEHNWVAATIVLSIRADRIGKQKIKLVNHIKWQLHSYFLPSVLRYNVEYMYKRSALELFCDTQTPLYSIHSR